MSESKLNIFAKFKQGLSRTKASFIANLESVFAGFKKIDEELFTDLEDTLIMADVGVPAAGFLIGQLKKAVKENNITDPGCLKTVLIDLINTIFQSAGFGKLDFNDRNKVYLVVGVNGVGKTTTIAKMAARFKENGRQVLLVAGDTFRAAAIEQLIAWGERLGITVIHHQEGADPAAVVFDGMAAANARKADIVIIDTAGRLHTKVNLMEELKKIKRVLAQNLGERTLQTILVIDATTGQNAVNQTKVFQEALQIDGLVLTKLDGTAKGGVVLALANQFKIPILLIGVGEKYDDLQPFESLTFTKALFD